MILLTGAAGYIGSHIVYDLNDKGYNVFVFDDLSSGFEDNIDKRSKFIKGNIFDLELLNKSLKNIDTVIHLAALKNAGESMINPLKYANHNIVGALNLISASVANKVKNFIFSSTAAVYGNPNYLPVDESHPLNPVNYYGYTKLCIEKNLLWFNKINGLKIACLRYFNAAGYDLNGRIKCKEKNPANLLPIVMEVAANQREKIQIFGDDYNTHDGTCLRDYIHVSDLASAHEMSLRYLRNNDKPLVLNLATGNSFSVLDVIREAEIVTGKTINYEIIDRRPGDTDKLYSKSINAKKTINWDAKLSDLNTIINSMWSIYK